MFIERNLYSPLRMQIEKIIKSNKQTGLLTINVDKDRPKQENQQNNNQEKNKDSKLEETLVSEDNPENKKLDLMA